MSARRLYKPVWIMAVSYTHLAKVKVVAELMPFSGGLKRNIVQCLDDFGIPLKLSHTVVDIDGKERVKGITLAQVDSTGKPVPGTEEYYACDTLLLSCGLIPENELDVYKRQERVFAVYKTSPAHTVKIRFSIRSEGNKGGWQEETMQNVCGGIFVKSWLLFAGETLVWQAMDDDGEDIVVTEKSELRPETEGEGPLVSGKMCIRDRYFVPVCRVFNISEQSSGDVVRCVLYYYFAVYLSGNPEWYAGGQYADAA